VRHRRSCALRELTLLMLHAPALYAHKHRAYIGVGICVFCRYGHMNVLDATYFIMVTLCTVGYGDLSLFNSTPEIQVSQRMSCSPPCTAARDTAGRATPPPF
jgi:Ion channel